MQVPRTNVMPNVLLFVTLEANESVMFIMLIPLIRWV